MKRTWGASIGLGLGLLTGACGGPPPRHPPPPPLGHIELREGPASFVSSDLHYTQTLTVGFNGADARMSATLRAVCVRGGEAKVRCWDLVPTPKGGVLVYERRWLDLPADAIDAVAFEHYGLCALMADGKVFCDEHGDHLRLRDTPVVTLEGATRIFSPGGHDVCALGPGGKFACGAAQGTPPRLSRLLEQEGVTVKELVPDTTCVILSNDKLVCTDVDVERVVRRHENVKSASITEGSGDFRYGCIATNDGNAACWGMNDLGTVGDGTRNPHTEPSRVVGLGPVASVASTVDHSCALGTDHEVRCWGAAHFYALGEAAYRESTKLSVCGPGDDPVRNDCAKPVMSEASVRVVVKPTRVPELSGVTSIAVSVGYTCGLRPDASIVCVGGGQPGAFGIH